jgi:hypothetical protein
MGMMDGLLMVQQYTNAMHSFVDKTLNWSLLHPITKDYDHFKAQH